MVHGAITMTTVRKVGLSYNNSECCHIKVERWHVFDDGQNLCEAAMATNSNMLKRTFMTVICNVRANVSDLLSKV